MSTSSQSAYITLDQLLAAHVIPESLNFLKGDQKTSATTLSQSTLDPLPSPTTFAIELPGLQRLDDRLENKLQAFSNRLGEYQTTHNPPDGDGQAARADTARLLRTIQAYVALANSIKHRTHSGEVGCQYAIMCTVVEAVNAFLTTEFVKRAGGHRVYWRLVGQDNREMGRGTRAREGDVGKAITDVELVYESLDRDGGITGTYVIAMIEIKTPNTLRQQEERLVQSVLMRRGTRDAAGVRTEEREVNSNPKDIINQCLAEMHYHLAPFLILCNWNSYYLLHKPDDQDETISPHVQVAETIAGPHEVHNQNIRRRTPLGFVLGTTLLALERFGLEEASWNPNDGRHDGSDEGGRLSTETYRPPRDSGDDMNVDDDLSGAGGDAFGGPGRSNQASFYDVTQRSHAITGTPPSSLTTNPTVRPYVSNTLLSSEFGLPSPPSSVPSDSPPRGKVETANTDLPSSAPISSESLFRSPPKMTARSRVARPLAVSPPPLDMELGTPELSPEMTHTVDELGPYILRLSDHAALLSVNAPLRLPHQLGNAFGGPYSDERRRKRLPGILLSTQTLNGVDSTAELQKDKGVFQLLLDGYKGRGGVWDVFSGGLSSESGMRPSDIRATSRPRSTGTLDSLAIKLTDLSSFPTSIRLYYGRTLPTVDEVSAAILKEYEIYLRLKEDGLEGDIAPNFFGLWGSAQSQNSVKSTTDQGQEDEEDTAVREGDKSSRQVWLLVLQDVGESMSKGEKDVSGVRRTVLNLYTKLHSAGIVHNDVDWRHVLAPRVKVIRTLPSGHELTAPVKLDRIRLIDFGRAKIRSRADDGAGTEMLGQPYDDATWSKLCETEILAVETMMDERR